MAWIRIIQENEAIGKLKEMYDKLTGPWGGVDNIMKIHSLNPRSLWAHFGLYKWLMRTGYYAYVNRLADGLGVELE